MTQFKTDNIQSSSVSKDRREKSNIMWFNAALWLVEMSKKNVRLCRKIKTWFLKFFGESQKDFYVLTVRFVELKTELFHFVLKYVLKSHSKNPASLISNAGFLHETVGEWINRTIPNFETSFVVYFLYKYHVIPKACMYI